MILPEIIITPGDDTRKAVLNAKEMFPDKQIRNAIYKDYDLWAIDELGVSQTDAINRLHNLYVKSGKPKLSKKSSLIMKNREHYNPLNNTIYLPDPTFDGYVAELTHANQNATGKWTLPAIAKDIVSHPIEWFKNAGSTHYDPIYQRKGGYEYNAHKEIEPKFWNYIAK